MKNNFKKSFFFKVMIILLILPSCSVATIDRSLVNSDMMDFENMSDISSISPHTQLKSKGGASSGGCSVCAH